MIAHAIDRPHDRECKALEKERMTQLEPLANRCLKYR